MDGTYSPPMSWKVFGALVLAVVAAIIVLIIVIRIAYSSYLRYQLNKNRDYNVFREVKLSKKEQRVRHSLHSGIKPVES